LIFTVRATALIISELERLLHGGLSGAQKISREGCPFDGPFSLRSDARTETQLIEAKSEILKSGYFLAAIEVAKLTGFSKSNVEWNRWKENREIFAIQHGREDYLPLYGLDPADHRPRKEMAEILKVFGDAKDGWALAFWFAGLNSFLDDERPQDVLATDPERLIAAAKDEMAELQKA
jgi:hypothetical protein